MESDISREIASGDEAAMCQASACLRAEKTALRLIARAEQCTNGLRLKLEKKGYETACIDTVIDRLTSLQLLDDSRFARLWLTSRIRLPRSPKRLFTALRARGIDHDDAGAALKNVLDDDAEYAMLLRFVRKYMRKTARKNESEDVIRSLKYMLKSEGFSSVAIQRYLEENQDN